MDRCNLADLLDKARKIARAAGEAILSAAAEDGDVHAKADGSPLTRADLASHRAIESGLEALAVKFPIISEEGDLDTHQNPPSSGQTYWLVDPLDGTKEFIKGLGEYTVNIALIERGRPVLGVIYVPAEGTLYYAAKDLGAWRQAGGAAPERIRANDCEHPGTAVVSRSHLSPETEAFLSRLNVAKTIPRGSSLKMCAVAEGQADIYPRFGPTWLWDTAAGTAIATEADCRVVDLAGRPLLYDPAAGMKHAGFIVYPSTLHLSIGEETR